MSRMTPVDRPRLARGIRQAKPKGSSFAILRRMLGLFSPFKWQLAGVIILALIGVALSLVPALLLGQIVNEATVLAGEGPASRGRIIFLAGVGVGVVITSGLLGVLRSYITQVVGQGLMYNLRITMHTHLQRLSVRFFTDTKTGEILSRVMNDISGIQQVLTGTFTDFFTNVMTLAMALAIMFYLDWRIALLLAAVLPIWVYPTIKVGSVQRRLQLEWQQEAAEMSGQLEETLSVSGSMLVKTFGRQDYEAERFDQSSQTMRRVSIQRMMAGRWFNFATELFGGVALLLVYSLGGIAAVGGDVSIGEVVTFAVLAQRVFQPFQGVMRINTTILSSLALFERIFEYLDIPVEVAESPKAIRIEKPQGRVEFRDVSFRYKEEAPKALDGVSFTVEPGKMLALVGPSGAGKTTITYLIQRFYDPSAGTVLLDGHDLRDLTLDSISDTIGTVMQDTYLFHTTLAENIRYGHLDASEAEVAAAASAAGLDEMIERLPDGLETVVGERGYRLSGGEKQRVAIARAVLKDPSVLILDEATASLDSRLEREVHAAMVRLASERTTIAIAHRLSTVIAADQILVLNLGKVVEMGNHTELLAKGGLYATLYHEQFERAVEGAEPKVLQT